MLKKKKKREKTPKKKSHTEVKNYKKKWNKHREVKEFFYKNDTDIGLREERNHVI